jgi:Dolichyl-phosphate-mannose-protein mannosyltransferase
VSKRRGWAVGVLVLVVLAAAAVRTRLLDIPIDRDEGEYAYFAQLLLQGVPPYAEAYNFKMPGIYAAYALILVLLGQTATAIHLGLLVVDAATTVLLFLVSLRLGNATVAAVAAAVFATLALSPRLFFSAAYAEHFVLVPGLAGTLALLRALDRRRWPAVFAAGLLFGMAFLLKQSGGAFLLFAVLYVLLGASRPARERLVAAAALVTGALVPFAALCLALWIAGTLANFWFWTFTYAYEYTARTTLAQGLDNLRSALASILATSYLVAALAALGLSAFFWDRATRPQALFVALFGGTALVATSTGLYFRNQYFILLLPCLAILAGFGVDAVARGLATVRAPVVRYGLPCVLAAGPLLHLVYLERAILFSGTPHQVLRALYGVAPFPESVEIARYIRERTAPDDRIAVVGSEPQIYFYAGRRAATGYVYTYALMEPHPYAASMQRQMIREIEAHNPRFVVFVKVMNSWLITTGSDQAIFQWFAEYQKRFERVGVVEIVSLDQTRYLWGADAATYTPRSDDWLLILERRGAPRGIEGGRP